MSDDLASQLEALTDDDRLEFIANIRSSGMQKLCAFFLHEAVAYDDEFLLKMVRNYLRSTTSHKGRQAELLVEGMKATNEPEEDPDALIRDLDPGRDGTEESEEASEESKVRGL